MEFDFIVIGSGPAGSVLSTELSNSGFKVALVDRAKNLKSSTINDFFCPYIEKCPSYYTPLYSNILGGNSELWHSKIYLLSKDEIDKFNWNINYDNLVNYSNLLAEKFKVEKSLITKSEDINISSKYRYSLRGNFRNIFKFLNVNKNKNISVYKGYSPIKILFEKNTAKKVVINNTKKEETINSKYALIFCAGGLGNPHLLLNLLKNQNKFLGGFLSDHPHVNLCKIKSNDFNKFKKIAKPNILNNLKIYNHEAALITNKNHIFAGMQLDYKTDPLRKLRRTFIRLNNIYIRKFLSLFSLFATKFNGLYYKLGIIIGKYNKYSFEYFFSQSPKLNNKVYLSEIKDEYGLKKININWDINNDDLVEYNNIINKNIKQNEDVLKLDHPLKFENFFYKHGLSGLHPSCTTKIGSNPEDGVVDSNLKLFDHDNIYVLGSSVFPFNGYTNPTWTIMTLSLRLSERLKKIFK